MDDQCGESRSFVKAFLQLYYCMTSGLTQNVVDIDNTSRAIPALAFDESSFLASIHPGLSSQQTTNAIGGTSGPVFPLFADDIGIQVGTGNTAVAVADDNLATPIANGSSAGQFVYYGSWALNYTTGASSASFDLERIFRNSSGGSIVVAEIGVYCMGSTSSSPTTAQVFGFCILRDVISPTVTVNNGEYLKVKYTITVSN